MDDGVAKVQFMESALTSLDRVANTSIRDIGKGTSFTNAALFKHFAAKETMALGKQSMTGGLVLGSSLS